MPKFVDYDGRYAFFEEAAFTIVRDEGVHRLSRHRVAAVLGTSITTIRRVVGPQADLRSLALREVERRRLVGRRGRPTGDPVDVAEQLLRRALPDSADRVAEELVWWRLAVGAPTPAMHGHEDQDGNLADRFAVAMWGYVPEGHGSRAGHTAQPDPQQPEPQQPEPTRDPAVAAVAARVRDLRVVVSSVLSGLGCTTDTEPSRTIALLDGLGIGVCLGHLTPDEACRVLRRHLGEVAATADRLRRPGRARPSAPRAAR